MRRWRARVLAGTALLWLAAGAAPAETRREESVGVAPITGDEAVPRDAAMRAAVEGAVLRTARSLLPDDFVPPDPGMGSDGRPLEPDAWLAERLGDDPFVYVTRFRILEDRGRRPAMFASEPGVEHEYVVVADVSVDAEGVRERLAALGLVATGAARAARELTLVIEGLARYTPLAMLREALEADRSVRSVLPVEFSDGRAVLAVRSERDARALIGDLKRAAPEGLKIVTVDLGPDEATLLVDWRPPADPAAEASGRPDDAD